MLTNYLGKEQPMRYLVKAKVKPNRESALLAAIDNGSLGKGSVAGDEYQRNMAQARVDEKGVVSWVEVCLCHKPLNEELPYWEEYFEIQSIRDAHARDNCRDDNGSEPRACFDCDCTDQLEEKMLGWDRRFLDVLREQQSVGGSRSL